MRKAKSVFRIFLSVVMSISPLLSRGASSATPVAAADSNFKVDCVTSSSPDGATTDEKNRGNCEAVQNISKSVQALANLNGTNSLKLATEFKKYQSSWNSCIGRHNLAANACLETFNDDLKGAMAAANGITAATSAVAGANDSCSEFSKIMNLANMGLTAYSTLCAAAKTACQSSCSDAMASLKNLNNLANGQSCTNCDPNELQSLRAQVIQATSQETNDASSKISIAGKQAMCKDKYAQLMTAALAGVGAILAGLMSGKKCEKDTAAAAGAVASPDCTDPSQAQTTTCLCLANPRLPGCENALQKLGDTSSSGGISSLSTPMLEQTAGGPTLSNENPVPDFSRDPSSEAASALPSGGGSANLGASSGQPGGAAAAAGLDGAGHSPLNTNIYGGSGSGGGGKGGGFGNGGTVKESPYRSYLPGGIKDPTKLNGAAPMSEVTGQDGKSNWEKVKDRYRDNKTSLLN